MKNDKFYIITEIDKITEEAVASSFSAARRIQKRLQSRVDDEARAIDCPPADVMIYEVIKKRVV